MAVRAYNLFANFTKHLVYSGFFEDRGRENAHDLSGRLGELVMMTKSQNQNEHDHRHPHLGGDRVARTAEKRLDPQVLLDPSEEQFDLPAFPVKQGDHLGGQGLGVGDEDVLLARLRIAVADSPDRIGVEFAGAVDAQADELIEEDRAAGRDGLARTHGENHAAFGAGDEERARLVQAVEPAEVDVSFVDHVVGAASGGQRVEGVDLVVFGVGNLDKYGRLHVQVEKGVEFDGALDRKSTRLNSSHAN